MIHAFLQFLKHASPFLIAIVLWRLSVSWINPGGILALIPIFFCSFIYRVKWFTLFAALMCFLIDYKMGTVCYWFSMYCIFYAINGFQERIDLTQIDRNGITVFMVFIGLCMLIMIIPYFSLIIMLRAICAIVAAVILYIPITEIIKRMCDD